MIYYNENAHNLANNQVSSNTSYDIFTGTFKSGKRHGYGEYKFSNGDIYIGSWFNDKKSGQGILKI